MSQHGAQDLASQGYTYNQILGHYYQGASLARLQAGGGAS
jgi:SpoIID/LytB domain protein